jgi:hypothetical protein
VKRSDDRWRRRRFPSLTAPPDRWAGMWGEWDSQATVPRGPHLPYMVLRDGGSQPQWVGSPDQGADSRAHMLSVLHVVVPVSFAPCLCYLEPHRYSTFCGLYSIVNYLYLFCSIIEESPKDCCSELTCVYIPTPANSGFMSRTNTFELRPIAWTIYLHLQNSRWCVRQYFLSFFLMVCSIFLSFCVGMHITCPFEI